MNFSSFLPPQSPGTEFDFNYEIRWTSWLSGKAGAFYAEDLGSINGQPNMNNYEINFYGKQPFYTLRNRVFFLNPNF